MTAAPAKPRCLAAGMTIGIVSPASPIDPEMVATGVKTLRGLGFEVVLGRHASDATGDLAGTDADRAADLVDMFTRPDVDAVFCTRGGTGSLRTLLAARSAMERLPPDRAKVFLGFSDVTFIHAFLFSRLGWTTFHGPMFHHWSRCSPYTLDAFRSALMDVAPFEVLPEPDGVGLDPLVPGVAEGVLVGGWLAGLVDLIGTPWELDLRGSILFFEDVRRPPRDIDRLLSILVASGRLQQCAGIAIGEHEQCGRDAYAKLRPIFREWIAPLGIPAIARLPIGHGAHMATLPLGARARLDATQGRLTIIESGVA